MTHDVNNIIVFSSGRGKIYKKKFSKNINHLKYWSLTKQELTMLELISFYQRKIQKYQRKQIL